MLPTRRFVIRLAVVYFLDWLFVLGTIAFAGSTSLWVTPNARPFSPNDPTISFPFQEHTKVPSWLLILLAVIVPGAIILTLSLAHPGRTWKQRIYSLNTAWLGLGLAVAIAMIVTDGIKNLTGRPRPDLLARCDVNMDEIEKWRVGPGDLLDWGVCRNRYKASSGTLLNEGGEGLTEKDVRDGFRSYCSGHSSVSFAGLTYLAIFLAEFVFALPLPHLAQPVTAPLSSAPANAAGGQSRRERRRARRRRSRVRTVDDVLPRFPIMAALLLCGVPVLLAMYIASTRYSDFRHNASDILWGMVLGIFAAVVGWRWYGAWAMYEAFGKWWAPEKGASDEEALKSRVEDVSEERREVVDREAEVERGREQEREWQRERERERERERAGDIERERRPEMDRRRSQRREQRLPHAV